MIEVHQEKLQEIDDLLKECKQELKDCRIIQAKLRSQLDQELHEEEQLKARLERLNYQRHFLSGLMEGLMMRGN